MGMKLIPWTVNESQAIERMIDLNVDGTTDKQRLHEVLPVKPFFICTYSFFDFILTLKQLI